MAAAEHSGSPAFPVDRRNCLALLFLLCVVAFAVRMVLFVLLPNISHPDEIFQYLEQAHRLVFGTGLVPWEYLVGARSWIIPGFLAGSIELSRPFGDSPDAYLLACAAALAAISLAYVVAAYLWGWRLFGFWGALLAGGLNAVWFESVYYATHALAEPVAGACLVAGLALSYPASAAMSRRRLVTAGIFYGLTAGLRLQLLLPVLVAIPWVCGRGRRRYGAVLSGFVLALAFCGGLDWITWSVPFQSWRANFSANMLHGVAASFGTSPWWTYVVWETRYWSLLLVPMAMCFGIGIRRLPLLGVLAAVILVSHSLIGLKNARFIFPAIPLVVTLVGIGTAEIVVGIRAPRNRAAIGAAAACLWLVGSAWEGAESEFSWRWFSEVGTIELTREVSDDPESCGLAVLPASDWFLTNGYTRLRAGIPLYGLMPGQAPHMIGEANRVLVERSPDPADVELLVAAGFSRSMCRPFTTGEGAAESTICLWRRTGRCAPGPLPSLKATFEGLDYGG